MVKKFRWWILDNWQPVVYGLLVVCVLIIFLGFQLGSLTHGLAAQEVSYLKHTDSLHDLLHDPIFLPHKVLSYLMQLQPLRSNWAVRLPSALFVAIMAVGVIIFLRRRYSRRIAILGGSLLISSSWLLSIGRLALPEASLVLWLPLLVFYYWLSSRKHRKLALLCSAATVAVSCYIPAFIWLTLGFLIWHRQVIRQELRHIPIWYSLLCAVVLIALLAPLGYAFKQHTSYMLTIAGLPSSLAVAKAAPNHLLQACLDIFVISKRGAVFTIGRLPWLDIFSTILVILGVYSIRFTSAREWRLLIVGVGIGAVLLASGGAVTTTVILPFVYIVMAAGLAFLLQQWFTVFPRNPLARPLGTTLLSISVLLIAFYHINKYYIAWPQTPETRQVFRHSLLK